MTNLSRPAVVVAAASLSLGLISGIVRYVTRDEHVEPHTPGTEAWIPHLVVLAVVSVWFLVASGRNPLGWKVVLAPLGRPVAARIRAAFRTLNPLRWLVVAFLVFVEVFLVWRVGQQVVAGLDPTFTHNAWGGPSYLGAMACHYLDAALLLAVCHVLLRAATPSDPR